MAGAGGTAGWPGRDRGHGRWAAFWPTAPAGPIRAKYAGDSAQLPRIGAIVLAAGHSSRMRADDGGRNKLLQPLAGRPMVRHVVEAALTSAVSDVVVVTGNEKQRVMAALEEYAGDFFG